MPKKTVQKRVVKRPSKISAHEKELKDLEKLNRSKSDFIAAVSHELRTPLAIVKQLVLLLYDETAGPINDQQREILVKSRHNIDRLKNMIDNLLQLSTLERDTLNLHYSLVNLNALFKDSQNYFKNKAQEKNVKLTYALPKEDVCIFVDSERILQVITNVINNAIKFTPESKGIKIEVKTIGADVRICINDTGIGIKESDLPYIFEKFVQVSRNSEAKKGVGMGLPIVKELIEKHKGKIWVESKFGVGTKFYFTLPHFYTAHLTSSKVVRAINQFLDKKLSVYVVNVLIVNYEEFKKRIRIDSGKLSRDLESIVNSTMKLFFPILQVKKGRFVPNSRHGRYSVIFPNQPKGNVSKFCKFLKEEIKGYFLENKIEDAFIVLGVSAMDSKEHIKAAEEGSPSIVVNELYIGAEMRRHKRIKYTTAVEVSFSDKKKEMTRSSDLSQGGLCFLSYLPLRIDSELGIKFTLLKKKKTIHARVRVAWLEKVRNLPSKKGECVNVGVEFCEIKKKDEQILANELKLYYE